MTAFLRRLRLDRGAVAAQLVLVVPALLLIALLVVQFALAWHARHIAQYTAQRALAAARVEAGAAADGRTQARHSLDALGSRILTAPSISVKRTNAETTVRVDGTVMRVIPVPGMVLRASGTASGSTERITMPTGSRP
ncbi:TadE/TadG family type IV pilus assembly protein [Streptomyces sp. NPDC001840]